MHVVTLTGYHRFNILNSVMIYHFHMLLLVKFGVLTISVTLQAYGKYGRSMHPCWSCAVLFRSCYLILKYLNSELKLHRVIASMKKLPENITQI